MLRVVPAAAARHNSKDLASRPRALLEKSNEVSRGIKGTALGVAALLDKEADASHSPVEVNELLPMAILASFGDRVKTDAGTGPERAAGTQTYV